MKKNVETRQDLIKAYINFFKTKGHKHIPSASLIPENDPSVLFTTAGMHPLVPFLLGQKHPLGKRLVNVQKCLRTGDIDEVGDEVHHTFFEMLGNWSLGDYWKKEAISFSFEFLTSILGFDKGKLAVSVFGGDERISSIPKDDESADMWKKLGFNNDRIAFLKRGVLEKEDNWWGPAGESGPCGPCTEIFYWNNKEKAPKKFDPDNEKWVEIGNNVLMQYRRDEIKAVLVDAINCLIDKDGKINEYLKKILNELNKKIIVVTNANASEIKNKLDVNFEVFSLNKNPDKTNPSYFSKLLDAYQVKAEEIIYFDHKNENLKSAEALGITSIQYKNNEQIRKFIQNNRYIFELLDQKNIDFGGGVERILGLLNGFDDDYLTSAFLPIIKEIENISGKKYDLENKKAMRIIADHIKAGVFILGDFRAVKPSNVGQGYVLRRLIRRAIRYGRILGIKNNFCAKVAKSVLPIYPDYQELHENHSFIYEQLEEEENRFREVLEKGLKKFDSIINVGLVSGKDAFLLFQSYGFPIEMTIELANEKNVKVDLEEYNAEFKQHQDLSRTASAGQFKSGLADDSFMTRRLHTATHLLNEALRRVLGKKVRQKGSNITPERLRFDFNFSRKLTNDEIKKIEELINSIVEKDLEVVREEILLKKALENGAQAEFGAKYPELVSVYTILDLKEKNGWFSKEICTGPHVSRTSEVGKFRIIKEEASSAGVRRIKAVVE